MKRASITATVLPALVQRWAAAALAAAGLAAAAMASGCFYPPTQKPPAPSKNQITIDRPYDMVWDAVHEVIKEDKLQVNADDPNQGIIETETNQFTLAEADCGQLKDIGGKHAAEPDRAATAVYFFKIKPASHESSTVSVQATFSAPLYVPLHPPRAVQCVSRGKAEAKLLDQVAEQAAAMHRPTFAKPSS
ncbi:MAG TPA: hypothetical protein VMI09_14560 [Candidatus Binataceae bacterium]|nr:hypothetical protein [Candidatus Binataceae bacterium]